MQRIDAPESSSEIYVRAIAFQEGEAWVAQGIEYDIVAHASSLTALQMAFTRAVLENACITTHLGRQPMEGIKAAPDRYREMFEKATLEVRLVKGEEPHEGSKLLPRVNVRVADQARAAG